ncbi:FimV/HubP family polar landmark protein [Ramlibacter algicola]|uniref:FimV/HubP family polar landmark protein n=1 Tax=Ramlibacter algicola TaxID=2795217 RepID=UPI0030840B74
MALATAALLSVPSFDAQALALGRVTVQSALGEPLRADIDLPEISADEVATLRAAIANPETFKSQGLEFSPALSDVVVTLEKRRDGGYFLRLTGRKPVNEPFLDVVLETNWASGRIRRDFTMLFDPPALRQGQGTTTAQATPLPPQASAQPSAVPPRSAASGRDQRAAGTPASPAKPSTAAAPAAPAGEGKQVTVQSGDTAAKIAVANKPASVSLDQMLVAMLRSNPDAFVNGNVNRLRAGAVLNMPTQEQAGLVEASEARQSLVAQSRDFNEFRRKVAEAVPAAPVAGPDRETRGKLQAQVEEKKPAATAPDKLTLSKGAVQAKGGEDKIARDRAAQDQATRIAELNRNLSELKGLTGNSSAPAAGTAAAASSAKPGTPAVALGTPAGTQAAASAPAAKAASAPAAAPATTPAVTASAPAATTASAPSTATTAASTASAPAATTAASAPAAAVAPATPDTAPAAKPAAAARKPAVPPKPEPTLLDQALDEPLVPAALGGLLALLLGFGAWKLRQRRQATQVDSSFLESRLQPDSFFGASGGQRIDTAEGTPTGGSSMVYSPSQLDAAGDVDPVAEADVYLAYGRDLQAEEILKEAVRINPQRAAIHVKLLEIYAKRRDTKAFEQVAAEAHTLTHGEGPEWARICELGQELDPSNPMYQPGGQPVPGGVAQAVAPAVAAAAGAQTAYLSTGKFEASPEPTAAPAAAAGPVDVDFDLDFSLGDEPAPAPAAAEPAPALMDPDATFVPGALSRTQPLQAVAAPMDMDFSSTAKTEAASTEPIQLDAPDLTVAADNGLAFDLTPPAAAPAPVAAAPAPAADSGMIEFDMGSLSLDLPGSAPAPAASAPAPVADSLDMPELEIPTEAGDGSDDPLATKLALAEEFNAIGDADGARSLAQEVIAEASGDLKTKAQKFLAEIS